MSNRGPFSYSGKLAYLMAACRDPRLLRSDTAVLSVLLDHANEQMGKCWPSIATISEQSRVPRATAVRAIKRLESAGWFTVNRSVGAVSKYTLTSLTSDTSLTADTGINQNANWSHGWNSPRLTDDTNPVSRVRPEQKVNRTGNRTEKRTGKKPPALVLPEWLNSELWESFVEARKQMKAPMTVQAKKMALTELGKLRDQGNDPNDVLTQSVVNGWKGVFPLKGKAKASTATLPRDERSDEELAEHNRQQMEKFS